LWHVLGFIFLIKFLIMLSALLKDSEGNLATGTPPADFAADK